MRNEASGRSEQLGLTRTLARGLTLLQLISEAHDGASVSALSLATGLDKGTTSRLLATLRDSGWASQDAEDRKYRLAGRALSLAHSQSNRVDLRSLATPTLAALRDTWNETVNLGTTDGRDVLYLDTLPSASAVRAVVVIGQRLPITTTALGRAHIAAVPVADRAEWIKDLPLPRRTAGTTTSIVELLAELDCTVQRGYAVDDEESNEDMICVGAAVRDTSGRAIAAISISGPSFRMKPRLQDIGRDCANSAHAISEALGAPQRSDLE